ncbi:hypothetical protein SUDANB120_03987 [Streptomyces sp. enrichment culture]|uniref:hypothetical protein n=1 Tax=Streptomyces TaxID=1883 RepID=UPI00167AB279|nr:MULTISPECIES: hypothetical protein [Streptomyces]MBD3576519.1 hypothetical protein [Streptomyces sp. KD18]GGT07163.1 hypothetical protein GCM10010286_35700 [Streptomyces toxytricini]
MISEPELEGEWGADRPAGQERPAQAPPEEGDRAAVRRPRGPWVWALAGAVLASAGWAAVPELRDRYASTPRIAYRHAENLCRETGLDTLVKATAPVMTRHPSHREGTAVDWAHCELFTEWEEGGTSYQMQVLVELHKKADPEAEFGQGTGLVREAPPAAAAAEVAEVPGLGERALMVETTAFADGPRLLVLDGGAVFTLSVTWLGDIDKGGGPPGPDEDAVKAAMIEDMRALMGRLRK